MTKNEPNNMVTWLVYISLAKQHSKLFVLRGFPRESFEGKLKKNRKNPNFLVGKDYLSFKNKSLF